MSRLIDADKIVFDYGGLAYIAPNDFETIAKYFISQVRGAPTVDAVEVVHGHWILEREPSGEPYCFHCSVCDDDFSHIGIKSATDYCPYCGAKMDEVSK